MEERKLYGTNETALILNYACHFCVISALLLRCYESVEYRYFVTHIFTCLATELHSFMQREYFNSSFTRRWRFEDVSCIIYSCGKYLV